MCCDQCELARINGVLCHETGCPLAYRDSVRECRECGCDFSPESRHQRICAGCANPQPFDGEFGLDTAIEAD